MLLLRFGMEHRDIFLILFFVNSMRKMFKNSNFYPLQKSIRVFGHDLVWLEEEYMVKFIGCCVSEGGGLLLRLNGSSSEIAEFASKNQCSLTEFDNLAQYRQNSFFKYPLPEGRYAAVSCRVRDKRR